MARHPARGYKCLINLKTGHAIEGVIVKSRGPFLTVQGGRLFTPESPGDPEPIHGTVIVERADVAWIQVGS